MRMNLGLDALTRLLTGNVFGTSKRRRTSRSAEGPQCVESLENRELLTVYTVTTALDDTVNPTVTSLREALAAANAHPGPDTINFSPSLNGTRFFLNQGELQITDPVKIVGAGQFNTVIDAQGGSRVFSIWDTAGDVTLDSLAVTGGKTFANNASGAGIWNNSLGTLTLSHSIVTENFTTGNYSQGGGIYAYNGAVTLIGSTVSGNGTTGSYSPGGGIATNDGTITLIDSEIRGNVNTAKYSVGGGIATYSGDVSVTNSTIGGNSTAGANAQGGGIYTYSGSVSMTGSTVSSNGTTGGTSAGGGISTVTGPITMVNSTVTQNVNRGVNGPGAGIATFNGNIKLTNTTVAYNATTGANSAGGGIFSGSNKADQTNTITLNNSIVANNLTDSSKAVDVSAGSGTSALIANNSLIGVNTGTTLAPAPLGSPDANGNLVGTSDNPLDPQLSTYGTNGGSLKSLALSGTSPAIDAGNNSLAVTAGNDELSLDQAGQIRIFHGRVDMGAYELQAVAVLPTVSFDVTSQSVEESDGVTQLLVKLSGATASDVIVPFTVSGTASDGDDYSITEDQVIIPAGSTSTVIGIVIVADGSIEGSESVIVTLGTPTNANLGSNTSDEVTINDDSTDGPNDLALTANSVVENLPEAVIGMLSASDSDGGNAVTFSIQPGGEGSFFTLNGRQLKVGTEGLDYETLTNGVALVTIRSTDQKGAFQDKQFKINIGDVNEAPSISPDQSLQFSRGSSVGTIIGTVEATDPDINAPNNTLKYSIIGGNVGNAFAIDSATGQITVANATGLSAAATSNFTLRVRVVDGGNPIFNDIEIVTVKTVTPFTLKLSGRPATVSTKLNNVQPLDPNATLANVDASANLTKAKITVTEVSGGSDKDTLFVKGAGRVTLKGTSLLVDGKAVGSVSGGMNSKPLVITFTAGSEDTLDAVLGQISARTVKTSGTQTKRTIKIDVTAGTYTSSATLSASVL